MSTPQAAAARSPVGWVAAFTALAWLGEYLHNRSELPGLTLLSPENSITALVAGLLFVVWWWLPARTLPAVLLLLWGLLHLVGGGTISVLPLTFLPFAPEQSAAHYLAHVLYGLAQVPLIVAMAYQIRQARKPAALGPSVGPAPVIDP